MSGDRSSRRYDIVAETRRRWSQSEKEAVAAEASVPGVNVSAIARRNGLSPSLLFRWIKVHGPRRAEEAKAAPAFLPVALPSPEAVASPGPDEPSRRRNGRTCRAPSSSADDRIEPGMLRDAMLVAALSGLRTGEIAQLRIGDCQGGVFSITNAKTAAGVRDVPVHEDLAILVSQRCVRKARADYFFHELKDPRPETAVERGQAITKQFVTARRRFGVDEMMDNSRQSRIDFHSFRRWFIARARDALQDGARGFDQWTICEVVGHDKEAAALGMTMGRYAGKQLAAARRACVNSVKLPVVAKGPVAAAD
jgi:transposase-like protein